MSLKEPRFLIMSEPRSGSNNISYVLNEHPDLNVGNELLHPLNGIKAFEFLDLDISPQKPKGDYHWLSTLSDEKRDQVLHHLFCEYNGFKIHSTHLPPVMAVEIARKFDCIVILTFRQNSFEQAISHFVAVQKGKWHADENEKKRAKCQTIEINPQAFLDWINVTLQHRRELWVSLHASAQQVVMFEYENIYLSDFEGKLFKFLKLLDTLQVQRFGQFDKEDYPKIYEKVKHFLNPEKQKMTDNSVARSIILNYDELKLRYEVWSMNNFDKLSVI